jgi:hypothetical protein
MPAGRPTKMTKETLAKLESAYMADATHLEAAIYADIDESTLHRYRKENPEFSKRIETLRNMTKLKAKMNISKSIDKENVNDSKWFLERRDDDFKPKSKTDIELTSNKSLIDAILKAKEGKE